MTANETTETATVEGLMVLVEDLAFEAGKSAVYVAKGGKDRTPEHMALKQAFNRAATAVEAYAARLSTAGKTIPASPEGTKP